MQAHVDSDLRYWERHAANYDQSMRVLGRPLPRMLELTVEAVRGRARVLEVAAGTGMVTSAMAPVVDELIATDYAEAMVARLRDRLSSAGLGRVRVQQADIYALPFEPSSFDAIVAANVLHLVPDLSGALQSLRRMLRPGGLLVAPTFVHDQTPLAWLTSRLLALTGFPGHRRFSARSLRDALVGEGLTILAEETLPGLLPIGWIAGRFDAAIE